MVKRRRLSVGDFAISYLGAVGPRVRCGARWIGPLMGGGVVRWAPMEVRAEASFARQRWPAQCPRRDRRRRTVSNSRRLRARRHRPGRLGHVQAGSIELLDGGQISVVSTARARVGTCRVDTGQAAHQWRGQPDQYLRGDRGHGERNERPRRCGERDGRHHLTGAGRGDFSGQQRQRRWWRRERGCAQDYPVG